LGALIREAEEIIKPGAGAQRRAPGLNDRHNRAPKARHNFLPGLRRLNSLHNSPGASQRYALLGPGYIISSASRIYTIKVRSSTAAITRQISGANNNPK